MENVVTQFLRSHQYMYSIDRVFSAVREHLPDSIPCQALVCPCRSIGIKPRFLNVQWARKSATTVNHITGDVHYLAVALRNRFNILTIHDCGRILELNGLRRALYRQLWFTMPFRFSAIVTVISEFTKRQLIELTGCKEEKIRVIYNPRMPGFVPSARKFNDDCPEILQVGTAANKNVERTILALRGLKCRLTVLGRLSDSQQQLLIENKIEHRSLVGLSSEQVVEAYRNADLVTFCSLYEGFGMPIVEAQATGRAIVTSNVASMPEIAGKGALCVNPNSSESIREAIETVIRSSSIRADLIGEGFSNIRRFDPKGIALQYAQCYREGLSR
jgi:glycosyltransferase involved in cell wall biosynthesis